MYTLVFRSIGVTGLAGLIAIATLRAASFPGPAIDENRSKKKTEINITNVSETAVKITRGWRNFR